MMTIDYFRRDSQLNARHRREYEAIAKSVGKCVFCDLRERYVISRCSGLVLTVNLFPYVTGHLLVVPERHLENYLDLTGKEVLVYHRLARKALKLLRSVLSVDGVWLLLRDGQNVEKTVKHLHWQVVPYVNGLVKWNYQKIHISPEDLARRLRGW